MRTALAVAVVGFVVLSGCLGMSGGATPEAEGTDAPTVEESVDFGTKTLESGATARVAVSNGTLVVNRTVTDEHAEYLPDSDSVRYVKQWRHANHEEVKNGSQPEREPVYGVLPFEEWGQIQCSSAAIDGVWIAIRERTTESLDGIHVGTRLSDERMRITVSRVTTVGRDGEGESKPSISYERLDAVTPNDAAVRMSFENRSYSCQPEVRVTNTTLHED